MAWTSPIAVAVLILGVDRDLDPVQIATEVFFAPDDDRRETAHGARLAAGSTQRVNGLAGAIGQFVAINQNRMRSEEHTSELQSLMRISYAVFCLKKKKYIYINLTH